jgi:hypothetical protein
VVPVRERCNRLHFLFAPVGVIKVSMSLTESLKRPWIPMAGSLFFAGVASFDFVFHFGVLG